jgi:hypothetical protein
MRQRQNYFKHSRAQIMANLSSFCGVEIRTSERHVSLSMEYYWNKLTKKFHVQNDEIENSPLKTKIKRSECPAEPDEKMKTSYLQIIGSIIYGYTHCRLDLAFPVNMLTRIMHSLAEQHYNLLRKLLHYINGTKNYVWRQTPPIGPDEMDWLNPVLLNTKIMNLTIIIFNEYFVIYYV